jgi:HEAT repeat protein
MALQLKRWDLALIGLFILGSVGPLMGTAGAQDEIIKLVMDELKSGDPERQTGAIAIVRDIPGEAITTALAEELPNLSPPVQVQVLSTLADRGDTTALPAVVASTKAADESVRVAALKAISQLGNASNIPLLAQRAAETRGAEQKAARDSLYRLRGADIDGAILQGLSSAQPKAKAELIRAVGERNITDGLDALLKTTKDEDRKVRAESFKVLKVIADPTDLPALVALVLDPVSDSDRKEAEKMVAAVAHKIDKAQPQAAAVLAVLPDVKDTADRASLLRILGRIGDNAAMPVLRTALADGDKTIQDAALRALCEWPTAGPVPDLVRVAETSDNRVHQVLALRGFVRLLALESDRPADETLKLYQKALNLAPSDAEKKRVLSGLGAAGSLPALEMVTGYLDDPVLKLEAESAAVQLARTLGAKHPQQCKDVLAKVIAGTGNDTIRQRAQDALKQLDGAPAP